MSNFDFSKTADRSRDHSLKFHGGLIQEHPDLLPMWVADMDFPAPKEVTEAIAKRASLGVFGYTAPWKEYHLAVMNWMKTRHQTDIAEEWIISVPGIVPAIKILIQALTKPDDAILILPPVYHPFKASIEEAGRNAVESPLILKDGQYKIDFEDLEAKIVNHQVSMLIFCSPHNPTGNVWDKEDLHKVAVIAKAHGVLLVSDEIHMDFAHSKKHHTIFEAAPEMLENTILATAPSKTFNLAGLQVSTLFVPNADYRKAIEQTMSKCGMSRPNILGMTAAQAAYENGAAWVDALNEQIRKNALITDSYLKTHIPESELIQPQGLYLFWLDCRRLNLSDEELETFFIEDASLWLNPGILFGKEGSGFMRLNAATSEATIRQALSRLDKAVQNLRNARIERL